MYGGNAVTWDGHLVGVPKRDLVSAVQVLLQDSPLKITAALPEATTLAKELSNFKVKIDPVAVHDSYSAWRKKISTTI